MVYYLISDMQRWLLKEGREQTRKKTWANIGHSAEMIADYLIRKKEQPAGEAETPEN